MKVLTRVSTKGASMARGLLFTDKTARGYNHISGNSAVASSVSVRGHEKVAIQTSAASVV